MVKNLGGESFLPSTVASDPFEICLRFAAPAEATLEASMLRSLEAQQFSGTLGSLLWRSWGTFGALDLRFQGFGYRLER